MRVFDYSSFKHSVFCAFTTSENYPYRYFISLRQNKNQEDEKNTNEKEDSDVEAGDRDSDDSDQSASASGYSSGGSDSEGIIGKSSNEFGHRLTMIQSKKCS